MKRREFVTLLGSAAAAMPFAAARAQDTTRIRKVGVLTSLLPDDPEGQSRIRAFAQALQRHGWVEGQNLRTETRWTGDSAERSQQYAKELIELAPEVVLASTSPCVVALQRVTRDLPIIFANVIDPVGAGFVTSLARPGGNTTGFIAFEYSISAKWLELLRELSPASSASPWSGTPSRLEALASSLRSRRWHHRRRGWN